MRCRPAYSKIALVAAATLSVSACGGGGTRTPVPVQPNIAPPPVDNPTPDPDLVASFKTAEYNRSWGLDAVNAAEAYALGYTGEDVIIAVIDFNFTSSTDEFDLHPASTVADPDNVRIYEAQFGEPVSTTPHGIAVAATAAGTKDDTGIHGVAFDATVLAVDFFSGVNSREVFQNGALLTISDPWTYAFDRGARIFNKSLGFDEDDIIDNPPAVDVRYTIEFDTTAVALGGLLVSSAGNNSDPEPSLSNLNTLDRLASLGLLNEGPGAFIIAGSVDEDLTLSSFSDAAGAGESRFHYLVAPGGLVTFPWIGGELVIGNGTSFAAPHISGAAAVVLSRWPNLTAREVADILFETATDLGAAGIDPVYGNGLLNLEAAVQPVGQAKLAVPQGPSQSLTAAAINLGSAFGDAGGLHRALSNVLILDKYDRDFFTDASSLVTSGEGRANIEARIDERGNWQSASLNLTQKGQLNYAVSLDTRSIPAFALAGQAEADFAPKIEAVFEFAASYGEQNYIVGTGRSLSSAMAREPYSQAVGGSFSLTGANDTVVPIGSGIYFALNEKLSGSTDIWFGASRSKAAGQLFHPVEALQQDSDITAFAMRIDHYSGDKRFSAEFGASVENGSLLGGRAAGGLRFGSGATTNWLTVSGGWHLSDKITLESKATIALTNTDAQETSLIGDLGPITSSAFQLKASFGDALMPDDGVTVTLNQPLRVENASATLTTGSGLDRVSGDVIFTTERFSLAPIGREIALEVAYRLPLKGWNFEANAAFRRDAGHFRGQRDALFAFGVSRHF